MATAPPPAVSSDSLRTDVKSGRPSLTAVANKSAPAVAAPLMSVFSSVPPDDGLEVEMSPDAREGVWSVEDVLLAFSLRTGTTDAERVTKTWRSM